MEVVSKRYNHDHVSAYKSRSEKLGVLGRFARANQAKEERKTLRRNELTKRRGITEINTSIEEVKNVKKKDGKADKNDQGKNVGGFSLLPS